MTRHDVNFLWYGLDDKVAQVLFSYLDVRSQRKKVWGLSFEFEIFSDLVQLDDLLRLEHGQVPVGNELEGFAGLTRQADGKSTLGQQVFL